MLANQLLHVNNQIRIDLKEFSQVPNDYHHLCKNIQISYNYQLEWNCHNFQLGRFLRLAKRMMI
jgi:hypothetical protein